MQPYLALLRGVNVGGKNPVPMAELKTALQEAGFSGVGTYINSGNVLFLAPDGAEELELQERCRQAIFQRFGLSVAAAVFSASTIRKALSGAPSWWGDAPETKHNAIFVIPPWDAGALAEKVGIRPEYERIAVSGPVIFWSAPVKTYSQTRWSRLSGTAEYAKITVRNANTTRKLLQLLEERQLSGDCRKGL